MRLGGPVVRERSLRVHAAKVACVAALALGIASCGNASAPAASPTSVERDVDLKILLLDKNATNEIGAWAAMLTRLDTPFDVVDLGAHALTSDLLRADPDHARYAGVVVATPGALTPADAAVLAEYELAFGVRRIVAFTAGRRADGFAAAFGYDGWPGGWNGRQVVGTLTAAGRSVFPYLTGTIPFDNEWGVLAPPDPAADFQTLVEGPQDPDRPGTRAALVGIHTHPDGRQELVTTIEYGPGDVDQNALLPGQLAWVTKGVYLGHWRNYFSVHFDDVLGADDRWSTTTHDTPRTLPPIRMAPEDVARAVDWSRRNGVRLDLAFNGAKAADGDGELATALLAERFSFGWINHTWSHADLDFASLETITSEIDENIAWGSSHGVPRHPLNVAYNVGTRAEELDEFNWVYQDDPSVHAPVTWERYVELAARYTLRFLMINDPRSHFAHQNCLAEEGVFYDVADELLARYRGWYGVPLVQPTMTESAALLERSRAWNDAVRAGQVTAWVHGDAVRIEATVPVAVPLTGTVEGEVYGGLRSGWVDVAPGAPVTIPIAR